MSDNQPESASTGSLIRGRPGRLSERPSDLDEYGLHSRPVTPPQRVMAQATAPSCLCGPFTSLSGHKNQSSCNGESFIFPSNAATSTHVIWEMQLPTEILALGLLPYPSLDPCVHSTSASRWGEVGSMTRPIDLATYLPSV